MIIKCIDSTNLINSSKSGSYWEETHKTRDGIEIPMDIQNKINEIRNICF